MNEFAYEHEDRHAYPVEEKTGSELISFWLRDKIFMGLPFSKYIKTLITPLNIAAGLIVFAGLFLILMRFIFGLDQITEASNEQPWGLFLTWGLFSGVPFSASGFVIGTGVYIFGLKRYQPIVKNAILLGFLGYLFAVIFLLIDLGRPWRIYYPMFVTFGTASVMFLVAWHVALYLSVQFLEFCPSILAWLNQKALRKMAVGMTLGLTIFGVMLSTLHQSALSAMFLLAPGKVHPLWYTSYLPWLAFISAIGAAMALMIVVSKLTTVYMKERASPKYLASIDDITLGLGKASALVLFTYLGLRLISVTHEGSWSYLNSSIGNWFLVEIALFAIIPFLYFRGVQKKNVGLIQATGVLTMVAIFLNRFNLTLITFNWQLPHRELFFWKEALVVLSVVIIEILVYRWIVNRMPVLRDHPDYPNDGH